MVSLELADELTFEKLNEPKIELTCSDPNLPTDGGNLVRKSAELLQKRHAPNCGARIHLQKKVPIGAGLGGGSSNGTTTLLGLNRLWNLKLTDDELESIAAEFGSDTAFFVRGRPALSSGRGEKIQPIAFPHAIPIFLMNFGFGSATPWAYKNLNFDKNKELFATPNRPVQEILDQSSQSRLNHSPFRYPKSALFNHLEIPVFKKFPILAIARELLSKQSPVIGSLMSGSGSTMMALLTDLPHADFLREIVHEQFGNQVWTWAGRTIPSN